jgi:DNA repair and recombination protein RAD52
MPDEVAIDTSNSSSHSSIETPSKPAPLTAQTDNQQNHGRSIPPPQQKPPAPVASATKQPPPRPPPQQQRQFAQPPPPPQFGAPPRPQQGQQPQSRPPMQRPGPPQPANSRPMQPPPARTPIAGAPKTATPPQQMPPQPTNTPSNPPIAFFTGRAALSLKSESDVIPDAAPAFNPHRPTTIPRSAGIDHTKSSPIARKMLPQTTPNYVDPMSSPNRQIGMPRGTSAFKPPGTSAFKAPTTSAFKAPAMAAGVKRPAENG